MAQIEMGQVIAIASLALALVTVALTARRDRSAERERQARRVAEQQVMTDKLDTIQDMSRETRDTVREMNRRLGEHGKELARLDARIQDHDRRLDVIEGRLGGRD